MKNMKVAAKLTLSFIIMIAISLVIGVLAIVGTSLISAAGEDLYTENYIATLYSTDMVEEMQLQRVLMRQYVIYNAEEAGFKNAVTALDESDKRMQALFTSYDPTITEDEDREGFDDFLAMYEGTWSTFRKLMYEAGAANENERAKEVLTEYGTLADEMTSTLKALQNLNVEMAEKSVANNKVLSNIMTYLSIGAILLAILVAVILTMYISKLIARPLNMMHDQLLRISSAGDLEVTQQDAENLRNRSKDEIGQCIEACGELIKRFNTLNTCLGQVANGDLTVSIDLLSEKDSMGLAMDKMISTLSGIFNELRTSSDQVSGGSKQIADGAQSLAQGSTEQASAVEQLSASINEVSGSIQSAAGAARGAAEKAEGIRQKAEQGSAQMNSMLDAVHDINEASQSIGKVITVIDNIAFQTNILALNAAVEAARAGQHGRGFAVVAEEVRSLAAKSADAAKETGVLIQNSIAKAELGARIAGETSTSLQEIVSGINETSAIVSNIAQSAEEQAVAIKQINTGIDQVAQVVQQNSATAEESAAAAEEMSSQAVMLDSLVAQFKLQQESNHNRIQMRSPGKRQTALPAAPQREAYDPQSGYGKY